MKISSIRCCLLIGLLLREIASEEITNPYQRERDEKAKTLKCNLDLTKTYIVTDFSGTLTEPIEADSTITDRCPMITHSFCSPSEIVKHFDEAYNRLIDIVNYFDAIKVEFKYFMGLDSSKIEEILSHNHQAVTQDPECRLKLLKPLDVKKDFDVARLNHFIQKLNKLMNDLSKMFSGSNCAICDAFEHINMDVNPTGEDDSVGLKTNIRICPALFKLNFRQVQLIKILLKFLKLTEFMRCNGSIKAREAYKLLNPFVEHIVEKYTLLKHCRKEEDPRKDIIQSKQCKELCISFLSVREWIDEFNIITLARAVHQIYEEYFQDHLNSDQPIRNYDKYNDILIKNIVDWKHSYRFPIMYPKVNTEFSKKNMPVFLVNFDGFNPFDHKSNLIISATNGALVKEY